MARGCLGGKDFKNQLLEKPDGHLGENHSGQMRRETVEAKAERIVGAELHRLGWAETAPTARPKTDPAKLQIACDCAGKRLCPSKRSPAESTWAPARAPLSAGTPA